MTLLHSLTFLSLELAVQVRPFFYPRCITCCRPTMESEGTSSDSPPSKSVELQRQVDILLDPSSNGWPSATPNQSEYTFEVVFCNKDPFRRIPIFKTRYFDYPGGWVSEGYDYSGFSVNEVAQRSHAILMLLDGKK